MTTDSPRHDGRKSVLDGREPVSRCSHETPWVADLSGNQYAGDPAATARDAIDAVELTAPETTVDLVTHPQNGEPDTYLLDRLRRRFPERVVVYGGHCSCGGYVTHVSRADSEGTGPSSVAAAE